MTEAAALARTAPHVPSADEVLAALDPEQREVAASPRGPMCVLAGAGTGKTRAITHRIAYGVHSGAYQPAAGAAVTFTARAAGEMRTRLRDARGRRRPGPDLPRRGARQLHYFWPQAVGGAVPELLPDKAPVVAEAAARLRLQLDRTSVRDLAAEIEWAKVTLLTPELRMRRTPGRAGRDPAGLDAARDGAGVRDLRGAARRERASSTSRTCCCSPSGSSTSGTTSRRTVPRPVPPLRRRRVPGRQRPPAAAAGPLARRARRRLRRRRPGADHLLVHRRLARPPARFPRRFPTARVVTAGPRLPVAPRRSSPWPTSCCGPRRSARVRGRAGHRRRRPTSSWWPSRRPGRAPTLRQHPRRPEPRLRRSPRDMPALVRRGPSGAPRSRCCSGPTPSPRRSRRRSRPAGVPYLVRGGERFFARPEVRRACCCCEVRSAADDGSVDLPRLVRDVLGGAGWTPEPPSRVGRSGSGGSR